MKFRKNNFLIAILIIVLIISLMFSLDTFFTSLKVRKQNSELSFVFSEISIYINSEEKKAFADMKDTLYAQDKQNIRETTAEDLADMIEDATWKMDAPLVQETLENYGVYLLPTTVETVNVGTNVSLSKPMVFYNAENQTWTVTYSGSWINNKWDQFIFTGLLGQKDTYGISYTDITGTCNAIVKNSFAYITDEGNNRIKTTTNRSGGNEGFCFKFEDYTYGILKKKYVGYKWYGSCIYDSNWENFSSYVCAYHDPQ